MRKRSHWLLWMMGLGLGLAFWAAAPAQASAPRGSYPPPPSPGVSNEYCLGCHGKPDQIKTLPSGEQLYFTIDPQVYANSVHGSGGYACVQCHTTITTYPHPENTAQDRRDVTLALYPTCQQCHLGNYERAQDSVHQSALDGGDKNAAVCSDCHNPHAQVRLTHPDTGELLPNAHLLIPQTCARCHSAIYDQYKESVHGQALTDFHNPDVPACIDCHGVHNIQSPTTNAFRNTSTVMCADCHTDTERMSKYDISTAVLSTYLADFHGTTVTLFQKEAPDQVTNKPVCFDCHGVHDIARPDDPERGLHMQANVLAACQKCHPDATPNFPASWLSHYEPSAEKNPLVYYVNLFYQFFIPGVLAFMAVFVVSDFGRRMYTRFYKGAARHERH